MNAPVKAIALMDIRDGKKLIAACGKVITVTPCGDGKNVYIPTGKGGNIVKPACFVKVLK